NFRRLMEGLPAMNCRMKTMSSAVTALPRYRHSTGICRQCARTKTGTQALGGELSAHAPPHRRCFRIRITGGEQQLRMMRSQCFGWFVSCGPPLEPAFRQTLCGDPEALTVIGQNPDRLPAAAAKDKQTAGKGVGIEFLAAELRERVDALSPVDCVYRNQDAQLRRDLNQDADSHNSRLNAAR